METFNDLFITYVGNNADIKQRFERLAQAVLVPLFADKDELLAEYPTADDATIDCDLNEHLYYAAEANDTYFAAYYNVLDLLGGERNISSRRKVTELSYYYLLENL